MEDDILVQTENKTALDLASTSEVRYSLDLHYRVF